MSNAEYRLLTIDTHEEYTRAMCRVSKLMEKESLEPWESRELDYLAEIIVAYEVQYLANKRGTK